MLPEPGHDVPENPALPEGPLITQVSSPYLVGTGKLPSAEGHLVWLL